MELDNVTYVSTTGTEYAVTSSTDLGQDEFLELLVTKLENQDPLNPQEDEDFIAQLAQFSSLEQLEDMNDSLQLGLDWDYILSQTISNTMATSLIGCEVTADASQIYLDSAGSAKIGFELDDMADKVEIEIYDANGDLVRTLTEDDLAAGSHSVKWDGLDESGVQMEAGLYYINVIGTDMDGTKMTLSTTAEGKVTGVVYVDGSAMLQVDGYCIPLSQVREVREG